MQSFLHFGRDVFGWRYEESSVAKPVLAGCIIAMCSTIAINVTDVAAFIGTASSIFSTFVSMMIPGILAWLTRNSVEGLPFKKVGPILLVGVTLMMWVNITQKVLNGSGGGE